MSIHDINSQVAYLKTTFPDVQDTAGQSVHIVCAELERCWRRLDEARAIAKRLRDLPPNGSKSWTGAECDALAALCDVLGVETE
jgi:hypothetical protein